MRGKGYTPDKAQIWLPHDGATQDKVYNVSYESALRQAGYRVTVVPNQGKGAAKPALRREDGCSPPSGSTKPRQAPGLEALGWYHEKKDEIRGIGLALSTTGPATALMRSG
jgi:phage terminase large subunit